MKMNISIGSFEELTKDETMDMTGGFLLSATLFYFFGHAVTGLMCLKAGAAVGLAAAAFVELK